MKYIYTAILFYFISCGNSSKENHNTLSKIQNNENCFVDKDLCHLFDNITTYKNDLSEFVANIEFVKLDENPVFSSFFVSDVKLTEKYIFLMGSTEIYQYDRKGKFIKQIGKHGQGPREYLNLFPPLQIDKKNQFLYAYDIRAHKILVYNFEGSFKRSFKLKKEETFSSFEIIDSITIAYRQSDYHRFMPFCKQISFSDYSGNVTKSYPSKLYPMPKKRFEHFGPVTSFLWRCNNNVFILEYGADTIYEIDKDSLIPFRAIGGQIRLNKDEYFRKEIGKERIEIISAIQRPDCGIFESDSYMFFRMMSKKERFFVIYDKKTGKYYRTFYKNAPATRRGTLKMDYFNDDIATSLTFNPQYQSGNSAISFLSANDIFEKREEILKFSENNVFTKNIKSITEKIREEDNDVLIIVKFK